MIVCSTGKRENNGDNNGDDGGYNTNVQVNDGRVLGIERNLFYDCRLMPFFHSAS